MPQETILKTKELEINMGPQHPSTHGVLRVKLYLDGERVQDCECIIGYLHRGVEKISENRSYIKCVPYYDRTDYIAAVSNVFGYVLGVEAMMGIDVPERAKRIRVMMTEFNRLASHLLWLATHAIDIGAMTVFLYCFREREEILKLFEALFGARLTTHGQKNLWKQNLLAHYWLDDNWIVPRTPSGSNREIIALANGVTSRLNNNISRRISHLWNNLELRVSVKYGSSCRRNFRLKSWWPRSRI